MTGISKTTTVTIIAGNKTPPIITVIQQEEIENKVN